MAKLADALVSGTSGVIPMEVRILSTAPKIRPVGVMVAHLFYTENAGVRFPHRVPIFAGVVEPADTLG